MKYQYLLVAILPSVICFGNNANARQLSEVTPDYRIYIDPAFNQSDVAAIDYAAQSWVDISDNKIYLDVQVADCILSTYTVCIHKVPISYFNGHISGGKQIASLAEGIENTEGSSNIWISPMSESRRSINDQVGLAAHELGHSFGLSHTVKGVMNWTLGGGDALNVSCIDYSQFTHIRGMSNKSSHCPDGSSFVLDNKH